MFAPGVREAHLSLLDQALAVSAYLILISTCDVVLVTNAVIRLVGLETMKKFGPTAGVSVQADVLEATG